MDFKLKYLKVPIELLSSNDFTILQKLLISYLLFCGFHNRLCWARNETLAGLFGVSIRNLQYAIQDLVSNGIIIYKRHRCSSRQLMLATEWQMRYLYAPDRNEQPSGVQLAMWQDTHCKIVNYLLTLDRWELREDIEALFFEPKIKLYDRKRNQNIDLTPELCDIWIYNHHFDEYGNPIRAVS